MNWNKRNVIEKTGESKNNTAINDGGTPNNGSRERNIKEENMDWIDSDETEGAR